MSSGGLANARLGHLRESMAAHVDRGAVPGVVTVVSRRGEIHVDAVGEATLEGEPMRDDTIFRISSMTKPVTAVAAMILVEECRLRLDEPVDPWLPELADRRVVPSLDAPLDGTVAADRPITTRDLLTSCMGFGLVMAMPGTYPIQVAAADLDLGQGPPSPDVQPAPDEWMRRLGSLPLMFQPGERWVYDTPFDVLGVLVARAAGQSLPEFLRERIFDPLGMRSAVARYDDAGTFIGSSYVFATLQDWCRFGLLALRDGTWDGDRLVPEGWIDWSRTPRSWDDDVIHGAQWWSWDLDETPFGAHGFEGQRIICFPARDVIVVRLGKSGSEAATPLNHHLAQIAACFPEI